MDWTWTTSLDQLWRSPTFPMWLTFAAAAFFALVLVVTLFRAEKSVANGALTVITLLAVAVAAAATMRGFSPGSEGNVTPRAPMQVNASLPALSCIDDLAGAVAQFRPTVERRLGVLVDHLVAGSKETRTAAKVAGPHVLVTGHPYVDVWQAVRPELLGIRAWPEVPPGTDWKSGVCAVLGWGEPAEGARRVLGAVRGYRDLETPLITAVEQLIDFVTGAP